MNVIDVLMTILVIGVSIYAARSFYFACVCLSQAIKSKQIGVTKYNYLRWEMPNNDIENQIQDEIRVNILYIIGILLWWLTIALYPNSLLLVYSLYSFAVLYHVKLSNGLEKRYLDYYEVFKTKKKREDFSDDLVDYGLRIEGTLTKLKKTYAISFFYIVIGLILTLTK